MLRRIYAIWYGRKFLPRGLRLCYNVNLTLFVIVLLFTVLIMIPIGNVSSGRAHIDYVERWIYVIPLNATVLIGIMYSCDGVIWRRRGARTPFFLSTASSMFILGSPLTIIGSIAALLYAMTSVRRYIYFDQEVDDYFGVVRTERDGTDSRR